MTEMLSAAHLIRLTHHLAAPVALSAILRKEKPWSDKDAVALDQSFASLSPLETLISLACCFHVLAPYLAHEGDLSEPLFFHADCILDDYAPLWLRKSVPLSQDWSDFIKDDLEQLGDLLAVLGDATLGLHPACPHICTALNKQAFLKSLLDDAPVTGNVIRFPLERRI